MQKGNLIFEKWSQTILHTVNFRNVEWMTNPNPLPTRWSFMQNVKASIYLYAQKHKKPQWRLIYFKFPVLNENCRIWFWFGWKDTHPQYVYTMLMADAIRFLSFSLKNSIIYLKFLLMLHLNECFPYLDHSNVWIPYSIVSKHTN